MLISVRDSGEGAANVETPASAVANGAEGKRDRLVLDIYAPIRDDLAKAEEILARELTSSVGFVRELTSRVQLYQGKRLRPALLLLAGRACGAIHAAHHTLAAVVEMIHVATLVHDDILDEAATRRHVNTVNREWGNEPCVLLGDYLFTHSFHLAATLDSTLACRWIGKATNRVCEGELHQISRRGYFKLSEAEYLAMIDGKTAELIACCCALGAHFAQAQPEIVEALGNYGREIGIAFQIADDLIDLGGDEAVAGKTVGSDLTKQKMTLPLIHLREQADPEARLELRRLWEEPGPKQRERIGRLLETTGAMAYASRRAREYAESAALRLEPIPSSPARDVLLALSRFVVDRPA